MGLCGWSPARGPAGRRLAPVGATDDELKLRTLTNLYNERPTWLGHIHDRLDRAVLAAHGWPADISDDLLGRLWGPVPDEAHPGTRRTREGEIEIVAYDGNRLTLAAEAK